MRRLSFLFSIFCALPLVVGCQKSPAIKTVAIHVKDQVVQAEVVSSPEALIQGLSGRPSLASSTGMLFLFPESQPYPFWMKDMKFSIDIIWINSGKVVDVWANAPPPLAGQSPAAYKPTGPGSMVLEVPAGSAASWGIGVGTEVQLPSDLDLRAVAR
jgi:uncharacterized membrane protein (UPF0127 family)